MAAETHTEIRDKVTYTEHMAMHNPPECAYNLNDEYSMQIRKIRNGLY